MAGSNPEATANSPRSPVSSANPSTKQAWKQRSVTNVAPAAVVSVPAIEVGGGPESWPALSESTAKAGLKPSPKASEGSSGFSPSPPPIGQETVSSPLKGNSSNPSFAPGPNQPRPKPLKRNTPNIILPNNNTNTNTNPITTSPVISPVPLHSNTIDSSSKTTTNASSTDNTNQRRGGGGGGGGGYGPNKWRANNNNNNNNNNGRRNQEYYEGGFQHRGGNQNQNHNQPRGPMRPQYLRTPVPAPGAPPQHVPFIGQPQPVRSPYAAGPPMPFPAEMGGPVFYYPASPLEMRGLSPFVTSPNAMMFPPPPPPMLDPQCLSILRQIDYYFSPENLCKDLFLRRNMDEQGWVHISLIAGFNKVRQITNNIPFILETLQLSHVVEVQGDKIRRMNDWMQWLLSPEQKSTLTPQNQTLITNFQNFNIEGNINNNNNSGSSLSRSSTSGDLSEHIQIGGPGPLVSAGPGPVLIRSDTL